MGYRPGRLTLTAPRRGTLTSSRSRKRKLKETNLDPTLPIHAMTDADEFNNNSSDCHEDLDDEDTRRCMSISIRSSASRL
jgi:hypothetical protein